MRDDTWQQVPNEEALGHVREWGAKPLPFGCKRYKYFSTGRHPLLKHDSHKNKFFGNEDYRNLFS